jgi:hypothetical protein
MDASVFSLRPFLLHRLFLEHLRVIPLVVSTVRFYIFFMMEGAPNIVIEHWPVAFQADPILFFSPAIFSVRHSRITN